MPGQTATRVRGGDQPSDIQFDMCRTVGHSWDNWYPDRYAPPEIGWRFSLRCTRCTCERHDVISPRDGQLMYRTYLYPEGYRRQKGDPRPSIGMLRVAIFDRLRDELRANNALAVAITSKGKK